MKKLFKTLLMLTSVFALTACGSDNGISTIQQSKINNAEMLAVEIVNYTNETVADPTFQTDEYLEEYDNVELASLFSTRMEEYLRSDKKLDALIEGFNCEGKAVNSAFTSFQSGIEDIGGISSIGIPESEIDDDTIIVTVPVKGNSGEGSVELIFSNDIYLTMESCTLNVDETIGQLMGRAALNTLLGMGTVFVVLILISLIISLFSYIPKIQASFAKKDAVPEAPKPAPAVEVVEEEELSDDTELVAVIAAAIAAYEGTASVEGFQVRSIKRANTNKWKRS